MKKLFIFAIILFLGIQLNIYSKDKSKEQNQILHQATGVYDEQENSVSNFDFWLLNNGILFNDIKNNNGYGTWTRASLNQYTYAGGLWFGCQKYSNGTLQNFVEVTYNPNNGIGNFAPGRISDGDSVVPSLKDKYRLYLSTDFDKTTGIPKYIADGANWSYWIDDTTQKYSNGAYHYTYVDDVSKRNINYYPYGPSIISSEDICSIYKDTDLSRFSDYTDSIIAKGYPIGLEIESRILSWNSDSLKDIILLTYLVKNISKDTLLNCYISGLYDFDLSSYSKLASAAGNDRCRYISEDSSLSMGVQWTNTNYGEKGMGFGYLGVSLLESPAVDSNHFIRKDILNYTTAEQIGLSNFRNLTINMDIQNDNTRYQFMHSTSFDEDLSAADKRIIITTGPFNMLSGDTARIVFALAFAKPSVDSEATNKYYNMYDLVNKVKLIKKLYYNQGLSTAKDSLHLVASNLNWNNKTISSTFTHIEPYSPDIHDNKYIILRNMGYTNITITGLTAITGNINDKSFIFDRTHYNNLTIAPLSSDSLLVTFLPDTIGDHTLVFSYNNSNSSDAKTCLYGIGIAPIIYSGDYNYGSQKIDSITPPILKVIKFYSGITDTISICDIAVSPVGSICESGTISYGTDGFAYDKSAFSFPIIMNYLDSIVIPMYFKAQIKGTINASISLIDCKGNIVSTSKLSGTGFIPVNDIEENNNIIKTNSDYTLFPNPANDYLYIRLLNNNLINDNISIYTLEGIKILDIPFIDKIDIASFIQGFYIIKIGNSYSRFIKVK